jgi:hypothetical protein
MSEDVRFTKAIFDDAARVIKSPVAFYKGMPKTGGYGKPVLFLGVMTFLGFLVLLIGKALVVRSYDVAGGVIMLVVIPTVIIIASFVGAAILYGIWKILGSEENYETAYRCMAYTYAVLPISSLLAFIPVIGPVIGTVWVAYLVIAASVHVHKIKPSIAWLVWGLITLLFVGINLSFELGSRHAADKLTIEGQEMEKMKDQIMKEMEEAQKNMHK